MELVHYIENNISISTKRKSILSTYYDHYTLVTIYNM